MTTPLLDDELDRLLTQWENSPVPPALQVRLQAQISGVRQYRKQSLASVWLTLTACFAPRSTLSLTAMRTALFAALMVAGFSAGYHEYSQLDASQDMGELFNPFYAIIATDDA